VSDAVLALRLLHFLGAAVLFGTGLGIAFFMFMAHRTTDVGVVAAAARHTVLADLIFTATAVIVQPVTGIALALLLGYSLTEPWLVASVALYLLAGACWLPVVRIQIRVRDMARHAHESGSPLPPAYNTLMRLWFWLGWPAFLSVIAIFALMVFRPGP